jgi:hypothetical protein
MDRYLVPRRIAFFFTAGFCVLAILHFTGVLTVQRVADLPFIICPFHALTHIACPGCGMTRALLALAGGDIRSAVCFNPFSFFLLLLVGLSLIPRRFMENRPPRWARGLHYSYVVVLIALLVYWVLFRVIGIAPIPL